MGRSKFRQTPLRARPKNKGKGDDINQSAAQQFAAVVNDLFTALARVSAPLFWLLPTAMVGLYLAALSERQKCTLCAMPAGSCEDLTTSFWDSRSFKSGAHQPFAGRFDGGSVFETAGITCKPTGVQCEWKSGAFGAKSLPRTF
jgi:hypothetical protein